MCGIYGFWEAGATDAVAAQHTLEVMGQRLIHRGPDDAGHYFISDTGLALGHRRLSIVDLSPAGRQPMVDSTGRYVISFNGEIYNYRELRTELQRLGHTFRTQTDTEVILVGYAQWKEQLFPRLAGMFALALADLYNRSLILVRDPTGIKPLFYTDGLNHFGFASEVKAFLDWPRVKLSISPEAAASYLEFGYLYDGTTTLFDGVKKLPAGHLLRCRWTSSDFMIVDPPTRWWHYPSLDETSASRSIDDLADELHHTLQSVVSSQLQADVPVGLLLSGGLDSSLLAAYASKVVKQPLRTICMGFDGAPLDERRYAQQVADHLGTDHHTLFCTRDDVLTEWKKNIFYYDDLFWDTGFLSSLALYRKCKELGLTVMLVGEGADELFAGYGNFTKSLTSPLRVIPGLFRYEQYRHRSGQQWGSGQAAFDSTMQQLLIDAEGDQFQALRLFELRHQIPNNLNMKVDRSSMANSIEARVPFQDPRLLQLATRWPQSVFLQDGINKSVLRRVAERYHLLPRNIYERPKFGMMMPGNWLDEPSDLQTQARESILKQNGVADQFGLRHAMQRYFAGKNDTRWRHLRQHLAYNTVAWRLTILALWLEAWDAEGVN